MKRLIVLFSLVFVFLLSSIASAPIKRELERGKNYIKFGVKLSNNLIYFQNVITLGAIDPTETIQPEDGKDAFLYKYYSNYNYGSSTGLVVDKRATYRNYFQRAVIEFDFSSIPSNADVTSVVMDLYCYIVYNKNDVYVYRILVDWIEDQVTWSERKSGVSWTTAGCDSVGNDREGTEIGSKYISSTGWQSFGLDADKVEEWINGSFSNNGMLLAGDYDVYMKFYSSDYGDSSTDPKITITYTIPSTEGKMMQIM